MGTQTQAQTVYMLCNVLYASTQGPRVQVFEVFIANVCRYIQYNIFYTQHENVHPVISLGFCALHASSFMRSSSASLPSEIESTTTTTTIRCGNHLWE